jgi:hypothetical protein
MYQIGKNNRIQLAKKRKVFEKCQGIFVTMQSLRTIHLKHMDFKCKEAMMLSFHFTCKKDTIKDAYCSSDLLREKRYVYMVHTFDGYC